MTHRKRLEGAALKYHKVTEEYDRKVCTGPIIYGAITPSNSEEMTAINRNARKVREELLEELSDLKVTSNELWEAIRTVAIRQARQGRL